MIESWPIWTEWIAVLFNVAYVILAAKKKVLCWLFGALASAISIFLFVHVKLYSEAILYMIYVVLAYYGWQEWRGRSRDIEDSEVLDFPEQALKIVEWQWKEHVFLLLLGTAAAITISVIFSLTDAARPVLDAFTTTFSLIATWLTVKRVLSNWIYWIFIDGVSVYLYQVRGLEVYAAQMLVFAILAAWGLYTWRKEYIAMAQ